MLTAAIACLFIGSGIVVIGSLMDTASRVPGMLRQLEADRRRLDQTTTYTGPLYNQHGREIEGN